MPTDAKPTLEGRGVYERVWNILERAGLDPREIYPTDWNERQVWVSPRGVPANWRDWPAGFDYAALTAAVEGMQIPSNWAPGDRSVIIREGLGRWPLWADDAALEDLLVVEGDLF